MGECHPNTRKTTYDRSLNLTELVPGQAAFRSKSATADPFDDCADRDTVIGRVTIGDD